MTNRFVQHIMVEKYTSILWVKGLQPFQVFVHAKESCFYYIKCVEVCFYLQGLNVIKPSSLLIISEPSLSVTLLHLGHYIPLKASNFISQGREFESHWMDDGWMTCNFTSFSKVFQSYQDDWRCAIELCLPLSGFCLQRGSNSVR